MRVYTPERGLILWEHLNFDQSKLGPHSLCKIPFLFTLLWTTVVKVPRLFRRGQLGRSYHLYRYYYLLFFRQLMVWCHPYVVPKRSPVAIWWFSLSSWFCVSVLMSFTSASRLSYCKEPGSLKATQLDPAWNWPIHYNIWEKLIVSGWMLFDSGVIRPLGFLLYS